MTWIKKHPILLSFLTSIGVLIVLCFLVIINPEISNEVNIAGYEISMYGLTILTSILVSIVLLELIIPNSFKKESILESSIWIVLPAVVFARLWHVITDFSLYEDNFLKVLKFSEGGLSIWGGILGGIVGIYLLSYFQKYKFSQVVNYVAVVMPLSQSIGRIGNYFNQELFGPALDKFWAIYIQSDKRPVETLNHSTYHPTFFYEAILDIFLFWLLLFILKRKQNLENYFIIAVYLAGYGVIRFVTEFFRFSNDFIWFLSFSQLVSLTFVFLGLGYIIIHISKQKNEKS